MGPVRPNFVNRGRCGTAALSCASLQAGRRRCIEAVGAAASRSRLHRAASSRDGTLSFHRISFTCHFAPSGEIRKDFYAEIPVSISVNGDYHSFALFTDKVAHYPRIVNLSNITFSSPKPSGDNLVLVTVNCTATTYRFLEQQAATAPGAGDQGKKK